MLDSDEQHSRIHYHVIGGGGLTLYNHPCASLMPVKARRRKAPMVRSSYSSRLQPMPCTRAFRWNSVLEIHQNEQGSVRICGIEKREKKAKVVHHNRYRLMQRKKERKKRPPFLKGGGLALTPPLVSYPKATAIETLHPPKFFKQEKENQLSF